MGVIGGIGARLYGRGLWKGIWVCREDFWKLLRFRVGRGDRVKFWTQKWCGDATLSDSFLQLYRLSMSREASVADQLVLGAGGFFWDIRLCRPLQDWELVQYLEFLGRVYAVRGVGEGEDSLIWIREAGGNFSILFL